MTHALSQRACNPVWRFRDIDISFDDCPKFMGILNVTPDSFSDGGKYLAPALAIEQALKLVEDGADFLDIGGESSRPGAEPVSLEEELSRVVPVIREVAKQVHVPISIDTTKAEVARQALAAGASIVNDISGLSFDPLMLEVCREYEAGIVCMHMQGTPQTMQIDPRYDDVVGEISNFLRSRLKSLEAAGIPAERVVLDPGVGFGKTAAHNMEILSSIAEFHEIGRPILIGHSRKRFLGKLLGRPVDERNSGTIGVSMALALQSTEILRVHDVQATHDCWVAMQSILENRDFS
ncbi:MAG: dihydropteroate synthase [Planctomycetaceae bacterium]